MCGEKYKNERQRLTQAGIHTSEIERHIQTQLSKKDPEIVLYVHLNMIAHEYLLTNSVDFY